MAEQRERNNAIYIAGVLIVGGVAIVWTMVGLGSPRQMPVEEDPMAQAVEPAPAPEAPPEPAVAPPPKPAEPEAPPSLEDERYVDLFAGDQPDFMAAAHARVLEDKWLDVSVQKQLYDWGQEHKDDARPQLLLAWDSMNRDWDGMAVRVYRMAYDADERAKYDPRMLPDLLDVAMNHGRVEHRDSRDLIARAYGEEALPAIDERLDELGSAPGDDVKIERLKEVRAAITGK